jgi:hypothetical protein
MQIDYAFICDYAEARDKVNALGIGFDTIYAQKLPVRHPHFSVVTQLRFSLTESGSKSVVVHLIDADGKDIIPAINGNIAVNPPPVGTLESTARLVMEFGNVEFKDYGNCSVRVNIEGHEVVSIPIRIAEPPRTG